MLSLEEVATQHPGAGAGEVGGVCGVTLAGAVVLNLL